MFSIFNKFFSKKNINEQSNNHSLNNSIYRLIFEIIAADHIIKDEEINITAELLKKYFNYDEKQTTVELIKLKDEDFFNSDLTKITLELKSTLSYVERVNIIKDEEINITAELLKKYFNYDEKQTTVELIKLKDENFFNSDLTKITLELKSTLSYVERVNIIKICWKVLLIDSDQDVLETATVRKISILLGIEDRDFISIRNKIKGSQ